MARHARHVEAGEHRLARQAHHHLKRIAFVARCTVARVTPSGALERLAVGTALQIYRQHESGTTSRVGPVGQCLRD